MTTEEIRANFSIIATRCGNWPKRVQFEVLFREKRALFPTWRLQEAYAQSIALLVQLNDDGNFEVTQVSKWGQAINPSDFQAAAIETIQQTVEQGRRHRGGWT